MNKKNHLLIKQIVQYSSLCLLLSTFATKVKAEKSLETLKTLVNNDLVLQSKTVTGIVLDASNIPVIGANVIVKGSNNGTVTDMNGHFSIQNVPENAILQISYIGYLDQEIKLEGKSNIQVQLKEDTQNLDEVIVVGYGVSRKRDLTGSVASVKGDKLKERASFSTAQAMQGKAAGVTVLQTSAKPGEDVSVRIRGNRSLKANNDPLYVVDGIPIVTSLSEFSPSDIESIEVLKDASATAIYGSRGANGVVLITTKKGKVGKPQIEYNGYFGLQQAARTIEMMNGAEWVELVREANRATVKNTPYPLIPTLEQDKKIGYFISDPNVFSKIENSYDENGVWHPEKVVFTDWTNEALQIAPIHNHDISVRGGTDNLKLLASATYFGQEGIVKGQDYNRYSVRLNFDWNINKYVTLGGQTQFSHTDRNNGTNLYGDVKNVYPLADIYDENGDYVTSRPGNDPQLWNNFLNLDNVKRNYKKDRFLGSYYLQIKLPFDIMYRSNVGLDIGSYYNPEFYGSLSSDRAGSLARAQNSGDNRRLYTWENLLFYNKTFNNNHTIGVTFLQSIQQETYESFSIKVKDLPYENQLWYNVGSAQTIESVNSNYSKWALASFMGRINYNLKDKYLLTISARYDGSSRLAEGHKWVLFPSAALAWRIKEESFLKDVEPLSNLKLRVGWGVTGNTAIDPYKTQGSLSIGRYSYGSNGVLSFYQNEMPNPRLGWEKTEQWNAGIDFGFINGRIGGSVDLYLQNTKELLMDRQLPIVSGFGNVTTNVGKIRNRGVEITLNTVNVDSQDFKWTTDWIFATNKEEIVELYNGKVDDEGNKWFIGHPVGVYYDYKAIGIWQLEDSEELSKWDNSFKPGEIKIADKNGDYKITSEDRYILGQKDPKVTFSISNYMQYRNFDFNFFLNAALGQMKYFDRGWSLNGRYNCASVNYWKIIGEDEKGNPISNGSNEAPRPNRDFENPNYVSSLYYDNASFLRIGQVTLGYTLPNSLINKVNIQKLRIYATVQNAYVFTKFSGTDPESGESFNEPMPRTYLLGVNLTF